MSKGQRMNLGEIKKYELTPGRVVLVPLGEKNSPDKEIAKRAEIEKQYGLSLTKLGEKKQ